MSIAEVLKIIFISKAENKQSESGYTVKESCSSSKYLTFQEEMNQNQHVNPIVFFDILIGSTDAGRIKFELFSDVVPKTAENFRQLCTGEYRKDGKPIGFKGAIFHRVIKDFMVQGGDFVKGDGTGITSIYSGMPFADENFKMKHDGAGILSMANSGKDTNGCQFFITCGQCDFLNGKHVVFGKISDGLLVLRKIENVPVGPNNKPKITVTISECGEM